MRESLLLPTLCTELRIKAVMENGYSIPQAPMVMSPSDVREHRIQRLPHLAARRKKL